jgi:hypothetical protein
MTTQTISTAAVHVVGQYNEAGKTLVGAYRAGVHRLLNGAASRYTDFLGQRQLPLLNDGIKARLIGTQEKINGFLANRLDIDTSRVVSVMDRVAAGTTSGIESVAKVAARVESPMGSSVLNTLGSLHMPIANVSVQIADKIAAGAKQIESRVAGDTTAAKVVKTVKAKAKPVVRRAVRSTTRKA